MIDLHTHTTCSDGTDTPRELVNKAIVQGIEVLGVTDHDTTSGWQEATQTLRGSLQLALGAEISCLTHDGVSVHMLGMLFDPNHQEMQTVLEETRDGRLPRMRKMIEKMRAEGMDISIEDVERAMPVGATMGRPHLADALVSKKIVKSRDEAFIDLLHNDSRFYVSHAAPTPAETDALLIDRPNHCVGWCSSNGLDGVATFGLEVGCAQGSTSDGATLAALLCGRSNHSDFNIGLCAQCFSDCVDAR